MISELISGSALAFTIIFWAVDRFVSQANRERSRLEREAEKEKKYESRFTSLETKVDLYWRSVETRLADHLHSPHTPEMDILLEKLRSGEITLDERKKLKGALETMVCEASIEPNKCTSAELLIAIQDIKVGPSP